MLWDRIVKALTFKKEVYGEVEQDESFTKTAWGIVIVVAFIAGLGGLSFAQFGISLLGVLVSTALAVAGFAIGALVISIVGRAALKAEVTFDELIRTLGLAYVWNAVGFLGILGNIGPALSCILMPVRVIAWVGLAVSWAVAMKEALDLDWVRTILVVVLAWIIIALVTFFTGLILAAMGISAAALWGAAGP